MNPQYFEALAVTLAHYEIEKGWAGPDFLPYLIEDIKQGNSWSNPPEPYTLEFQYFDEALWFVYQKNINSGWSVIPLERVKQFLAPDPRGET